MALVSESALRRNAPLALAAGTASGADDVLAADAWGHGAEWVASVLSDLGMDAAPLDAAVLFGLPGSHAQPVMSLRGRALGIKPLLRGEGVSYGYTHRAPHDTTVALVTGGYAQGVVRSLGNAATVAIGGRRHRIVGRVAMDVCVIDLGAHVVPVGTEATYFGGTGAAAPALARWSAITGLSVAELITVAGTHAERGWEA